MRIWAATPGCKASAGADLHQARQVQGEDPGGSALARTVFLRLMAVMFRWGNPFKGGWWTYIPTMASNKGSPTKVHTPGCLRCVGSRTHSAARLLRSGRQCQPWVCLTDDLKAVPFQLGGWSSGARKSSYPVFCSKVWCPRNAREGRGRQQRAKKKGQQLNRPVFRFFRGETSTGHAKPGECISRQGRRRTAADLLGGSAKTLPQFFAGEPSRKTPGVSSRTLPQTEGSARRAVAFGLLGHLTRAESGRLPRRRKKRNGVAAKSLPAARAGRKWASRLGPLSVPARPRSEANSAGSESGMWSASNTSSVKGSSTSSKWFCVLGAAAAFKLGMMITIYNQTISNHSNGPCSFKLLDSLLATQRKQTPLIKCATILDGWFH